MLGTFMEVLDTTVANVSLPHIAGNLSAGIDESTWILTSYLVSNAIILPVSGWLSRLIGRKKFFLICIFLFAFSSALCGLAPSLTFLVFFRILQGLGGGALQPVSQAILFDAFPREKQGIGMAIYGMGVVFAPIIGPTLGGWITDNFTWRWIFFINIPIGLLSFFLVQTFVKDPPDFEKSSFKNIDYIGLGLLVVGLGSLQIVLDKGQREDWFESAFIVNLFILMMIALIVFLVWELKNKNPVLQLRLFKDLNLTAGVLLMFSLGFVLYSSLALLPIYVQTLMGYTAMESGLVLTPGGISVLIMMPFVGRFVGVVDARLMVGTGLIISAISLFQMSHFNLDLGFWSITWPRIIQGFGLAFLFIPINVVSLSYLPKDQIGNGTGIMNLARNLGGSLGIALVTTILARRAQFHQMTLGSHIDVYDPVTRERTQSIFENLIAQGIDRITAKGMATASLYGQLLKQANMKAFVDTFWTVGWICLLILPVLLMMKKPKGLH
ncbi:MAG: DHA2 family efflux MFS transporter permease subunit [Nitrospirae bacterium]|nr:DHA2 family efflux MFS transporter permease subunit [Nitrospirota bacterium]